jgi:diphosphomevalonate decarboxylase
MKSGRTAWRSPSNIALVKYWGKKGFQLPANPSISMTLSNCYTETRVEFSHKAYSESPAFSYLFEGEKNTGFEQRIFRFLEEAMKELHCLKHLHLTIESSNSFPHSAGIASSASFISSLALCLCHLNQQFSEIIEDEKHFLRNASRIARIGSGSACRSVYGGWVLWGKIPEIELSSDDYAIPLSLSLHEKFNNWYDAVLIVNSGIKHITSSEGHKKMESNPFKETKFETGRQNALALMNVLKKGDEELLRKITEFEAASLHSMFLLGDSPYILIKPESLQIIDKLISFRQESGLEFTFTLDAGPNIHLLYPEMIRDKMITLITSELLQFCERGKWIDDRIGNGPELIKY